ncbi:helicase [Luteitalea sp. TBR-22]|uniref:DEAD/DEAH box helicase n=1 Tax=Luteitalea sp. TBR-22 TaxID=2802971 RepID=UPI001AF64D32|nr:helicase-related protein [Luteitalea sp. TBR-22]BCS31397.1 helicase [Luteitalea sp. TBR-22]
MTSVLAPPYGPKVLRSLRDFQRNTVEYVFSRLYLESPGAKRFLVADEVGLGKTMVAKGVVARAIDHLWKREDRIDVVYICSNASIARQNVSRLNVTGTDDAVLPTRVTLLPARIKSLQRQRLNFVSFTPGTSFSPASSLGTAEERALLYWLLPPEWRREDRAAVTLLAGNAGRDRFAERVKGFDQSTIDDTLRIAFQKKLEGGAADPQALLPRFQRLCEEIGRATNLSDDQRSARSELVGEFRASLASTCITALEPDLVILDEFQRFKDLLDGQDEASRLARHLFDYEKARVLLLSATPYKMYTLQDDGSGDDHFADFLKTVEFLQGADSSTGTFKEQLADYRRALLQHAGGDLSELTRRSEAIQQQLRAVMVRTERLAVTPLRDGMLREVPPLAMHLKAADVKEYVAIDRVSQALDAGDALHYWSAAPYLLNFMESYVLKKRLAERIDAADERLVSAVSEARSTLLSREDIERYAELDPANARVRNLFEDLDAAGAFEVPWVPPSMGYYALEGPFDAVKSGFTKRLVFSAWHVVPKVVACLASYEAERRLVRPAAGGEVTYRSARDKHRGRLRFTVRDDGASGASRFAGMSVLGLMYPSPTLAIECDPLQAARDSRQGGPELPVLSDVLGQVRSVLEPRLAALARPDSGGAEDERWYWAAPMLLDLIQHSETTQAWFGQRDLHGEWREPTRAAASSNEADSEAQEGWRRHVDHARQLLQSQDLGRQPADLPDVVARLAIAGPGTMALRSLARVTGQLSRADSVALRNAAGRIADAIVGLFNLPDVEAFVDRASEAHRVRTGQEPGPYWREVLGFCAAGGLQAVLDEYAHILVDALGQQGHSMESAAHAIADEMGKALRVRTATLSADALWVADDGRPVLERGALAFRSRFAVRFGAGPAEGTDEGTDRDDAVRRAFNSPFWPFVLCSTSVGQEGLDFHQYCHAVVHWNLPSNPVDLEQREGRVHRYKNHAVRRNLAKQHGHALTADGHPDPWRQAFKAAESEREESKPDLVPYWVYAPPGGVAIERHVPVLPLSGDAERRTRLQKSLALYRLAFGQSRQEDLVQYLAQRLDEQAIADVTSRLRLDLAPPIAAMAEPLPVDDGVLVSTGVVPRAGQALKALGDDVDRLSGLLDAFAIVREAARLRDSVETFRELLDRFQAVRAGTAANTQGVVQA